MKIQKLFALGFLVILFSSAPLYGQTTEAEEAYCGDCMETPIWDGWSWEHMAQYYGSGGGSLRGMDSTAGQSMETVRKVDIQRGVTGRRRQSNSLKPWMRADSPGRW
jgi:hypothetical protein